MHITEQIRIISLTCKLPYEENLDNFILNFRGWTNKAMDDTPLP